jgi:hypothetical protein
VTAVRTYIAGTGAAGALLGAAAVSFGLLTAVVAFNGFPIGGGGGPETVTLARGQAHAARALATPAALGVGGAPAAVAPAPVAPAPTPAAPATALAAAAPGTVPTPVSVPAGQPVPNGPGAPTQTPVPPGATPVTSGSSRTDVGNPVDNLAGGLDQTVRNTTGLNTNLEQVAAPVTNLVDSTLQGLTGKDLGETAQSLNLHNPLNGHPLVGPQGTGIAGTGLLP